MTNNYKISLNRGKHRRNLVSYLMEDEDLESERKVSANLQKKFEKFKKKYSQKG